MISLYELQCQDGEFVGCVSTGGAFSCECHEFVGGEDVKFDNDEGGDLLEGVSEEVFGGRLQVADGAVFPFSKVHTPHCTKGGLHIMCCLCGRKSCCFCAGTGEHC